MIFIKSPSRLLSWHLRFMQYASPKAEPERAHAAIFHRRSQQEHHADDLDFHPAGAFAQSAKDIGAIDATVNLTLLLLPDNLLLAGIFLAACFISLSIGTSVGTIVALVPVVAGIADKTDMNLASWRVSWWEEPSSATTFRSFRILLSPPPAPKDAPCVTSSG